jgi:NodT family efflux transporter outer membrane factor (OMF) lipoprotein
MRRAVVPGTAPECQHAPGQFSSFALIFHLFSTIRRCRLMAFPWVLLLAACMRPMPATDPGLTLPAEWKNAGQFPVAAPSKDLSRWWQRFNDATLNRLIAEALASSPDVATATARVREARARRDARQAVLLPSLDGSASAGKRHVDGDAGSVTSSSYSAALSAAWDADLFGQNRSVLAAAAASLGAAEESLHSVKAGLAAELAASYTTLRANEARLAVLRQTVATREETTRFAVWRLQAGEADELEASQARSSLESARAGIPALEQAISQNRNTIALLAGRNPGDLDSILGTSGDIPDPNRELAVGIPADTLRQRPDVRVAGYEVLAAASSCQAADAARFPSLSLSGSLGITSLTSARIFNPETTTANIVAGLASPIFDAGRLRANLEAAGAALEQTVENYRRTVLTALSETENALVACRLSADRLAILGRATEQARSADTLARQRYEAGEIDFTTVIETQRSLLGLEDSLLNTRADRTTAYIRLYQALGGGWSPG